MNGCSLCALKALPNSQSLLQTENLIVVRGPFWEKWPGHLQVVYSQHIEEQSDIPHELRNLIWQSLLCLEDLQRQFLKPVRINFAKFGNVVSHLHWHLIPRYSEEVSLKSSPWELLNQRCDEIYDGKKQKSIDEYAFVNAIKKEFLN